MNGPGSWLPILAWLLAFFAEAAEISRIEVDGMDTSFEVREAELYERWWPKPWLSSEDPPPLRTRVNAPLRRNGKVSLLGTFDVFPPIGRGNLELHGGVMLQLNL